MIVDVKPQKEYEKPEAGLFDGILADIVYIKDSMTSFGPNKHRPLRGGLEART